MGSGSAGSFSSNTEDFDSGSELELAAKKEVMVWLEELQLETNLPAERLMLRRAGLQASRSPATAEFSRPRMDITPEKVLEIQQYAREPISLDQTIGDEGDSHQRLLKLLLVDAKGTRCAAIE